MPGISSNVEGSIDVLFITSLSAAALSLGKPAFAETSRESSYVETYEKRDMLLKGLTFSVDKVEIIDRPICETCISLSVFCIKRLEYMAISWTAWSVLCL